MKAIRKEIWQLIDKNCLYRVITKHNVVAIQIKLYRPVVWTLSWMQDYIDQSVKRNL
jgi:hypothetical protein